MPVITNEVASKFAQEWLEAWNSHDLEAILSHYAEDVCFASPYIVAILGEESGVIEGKASLRRYWQLGLERIPDLHFELVSILTGINRITIYYQGHAGMVAESFQFDVTGKVIEAFACYALKT